MRSQLEDDAAQPHPGRPATAPAALPHPDRLPSGVIEHGRYRARFAVTEAERDAILELRFRIFNVELREGLDSSWRSGRDRDRFDDVCHHLLVEERATGRLIGTYRLQTREMARSGHGFYSEGEYDLATVPGEVLEGAVEICRACIEAAHRHRHVLFLLWKGIARYQLHNDKRYLFGCCSLTSQDEREGWRLYRQLERSGHVHPRLRVEPLADFACSPIFAPGAVDGPIDLPALFATYLRYGALVCSPPALDREFKTIDYLVLHDREQLAARTREIFYGAE